MNLGDVRDYIASLEIADCVYTGKLPAKEERSIGVQQQAPACIPYNAWRTLYRGLWREIRDYPCTLEQISKRYGKSRHSPIPEAQNGTRRKGKQ